MKTKHTKGEWKYRKDVIGAAFYIETVDTSHKNSFIGEAGGGLQSFEEIEANALLISKAPEMLDVLKGLVSDVENLLSEHDIEWQQAGYFETAKLLIKEATTI
ncbi:MAG: hypothetical protein QM642_01925 [Edaphocola sp.]